MFELRAKVTFTFDDFHEGEFVIKTTRFGLWWTVLHTPQGAFGEVLPKYFMSHVSAHMHLRGMVQSGVKMRILGCKEKYHGTKTGRWV